MVQALLFDLDGTLADTIEDLAAVVNAALARRNLPTHEISAYKHMVGNGFTQLVRAALPPRLRTEAMVEELRAEANASYEADPVARTKPYKGIPELLSALAERKLSRAVLSNKPDPLARRVVELLFPGAGFALVRGELPDFPRKPDPASALDIARLLGAEPGDILYLGDSDVDMETAKKAGMVGVGAVWGFRGEDELRAAGARHLVRNPLELLDLLD